MARTSHLSARRFWRVCSRGAEFSPPRRRSPTPRAQYIFLMHATCWRPRIRRLWRARGIDRSRRRPAPPRRRRAGAGKTAESSPTSLCHYRSERRRAPRHGASKSSASCRRGALGWRGGGRRWQASPLRRRGHCPPLRAGRGARRAGAPAVGDLGSTVHVHLEEGTEARRACMAARMARFQGRRTRSTHGEHRGII